MKNILKAFFHIEHYFDWSSVWSWFFVENLVKILDL